MGFDPKIYKAYDVRGKYPDQIDDEAAYKMGQAFVDLVKPKGEVMIGRDVRIFSEKIKDIMVKGITDAGVNVVDVGLISTDMYYFGVGNYGFAGGIQVTASHNPPEYHGAKFVRAGVVPISGDTGMYEMRDFVVSGKKLVSDRKGLVRRLDIWDDYCKYVLKWIDTSKMKPMKVVINPNFGLAGKVFLKLVEMGNLPLDVVSLNAEPDGTFPKGRPDPFVPENRGEFMELVKSSGADLGITWDADADRCFFCADGGIFVEPYYVNTLLIKSMLKKFPGEKMIYDVRYTWALIDAIKDAGGVPVVCKVGHSFIKEKMRSENALFGGESSGHTYYRDFWFADCGMIPAVQMLEFLSGSDKKLSEVLTPVMNKYVMSGEINNKVENAKEIMDKMSDLYKNAAQERLDGVSFEFEKYRFNLRTSNTEPLLRLCLEAKDQKTMEEKRDEVLGHIKEWGKFVD